MVSSWSRRGVLIAGLGASVVAQAQPTARIPAYDVVAAPPGTHEVSIRDITVDGIAYRLFRALPTDRIEAVLWMLDGNAVFDRLDAAMLVRHPHVAVIGVGYQVESLFAGAERALDYTPAIPGNRGDPNHPDRPTGGDVAFRRRLLGPLAAAAGVSAPGFLWGHSFGGLFVLSTLLTQPGAFAGYVSVSPSIWFGDGAVGDLLERNAGPASSVPVRILLGDREGRRGEPPSENARANPETLSFARRLAARPGSAVSATVLPGLHHGETFSASFEAAFAMATGL